MWGLLVIGVGIVPLCIATVLNLGCFSEMIASLKRVESEPDYNNGVTKASVKLNKAFPEADIRVLVDGLMLKNTEEMYITTICLTCFDCYLK